MAKSVTGKSEVFVLSVDCVECMEHMDFPIELICIENQSQWQFCIAFSESIGNFVVEICALSQTCVYCIENPLTHNLKVGSRKHSEFCETANCIELSMHALMNQSKSNSIGVFVRSSIEARLEFNSRGRKSRENKNRCYHAWNLVIPLSVTRGKYKGKSGFRPNGKPKVSEFDVIEKKRGGFRPKGKPKTSRYDDIKTRKRVKLCVRILMNEQNSSLVRKCECVNVSSWNDFDRKRSDGSQNSKNNERHT